MCYLVQTPARAIAEQRAADTVVEAAAAGGEGQEGKQQDRENKQVIFFHQNIIERVEP